MAVYTNTGVGGGNVEDFLEGSLALNVIPGYAGINEMVFHVMESTEQDYNSIMMECGVRELMHLEETGTEMIYEEGKVKGLVDKAIGFFKQMWAKVQGLIQKALTFFETKAQEFRNKVMKKLDSKILKKRADNLKADKKFGMTYDYKDIEKYSVTVCENISAAQAKVEKAYGSAVSKAKDGDNGEANNLETVLDGYVKACIKQMYNTATSTSGLSKLMKNEIRGKMLPVNGAWVKTNYDTIIKEVTDYPTVKRGLKSDYNELKKGFNEAIRDCKKANDGKMFEANAFTKAIKAYKELRQITVYAQQAVISCYNERQGFYRSVIFKLVGSKPAKEGEKKVSESATIDAIGSLFEWD